MPIDEFAELSKLNEAIDKLLFAVVTTDVTDDSYSKLADQLSKLEKIKQTIVETQLKELKQERDEIEFDRTEALKQKELELKEIENESSRFHRTRELQFRENEQLDTHALRKRELDLKQADAEKPDRVSKDALVAAGASLAGILVIVGYEKFNVIASKALGFVLKR